MKNILRIPILCAAIFISLLSYASEADSTAKNNKAKVYKFNIKEEIAPPAWRKTQKAFKEANEMKADLVLIHLNTYGGLVNMADSIRTAILNSPIKTIVFIDNNAASAGALISIACDSIYMRPGANIGAATVVNQTGEAMPDKYQSYMRSTMRSTAETQGRDPNIAQAMVDPRIEIPGIIDSGKVLTFTTSEAIQNNYCEGQAETIQEVLHLAGINHYEITEQTLSSTDKIINLLIKPFVSSILIMIIIGGIYFELQTPGIGFPIGAAIIAALLYFAPLYLEGLAANWEIILFIVGLILLGVEIFVIPGFGVAGIFGILFIISGLTLSMIDNVGFEFSPVDLSNVVRSLMIVVGSILFALFGSFYLTRKLLSGTNFLGSKIVLTAVENKEAGYISHQSKYHDFIGKEAITSTILRPAGKIEIEEEAYDATAESGYIEKNEKVLVVRYENMQLIVRKI